MNSFENNRLFNPCFVCENRLAARATVIPALHSDVYFKNKEESELITNLNGQYKFCFREFDDINGFQKKDYDDTKWDIIDVPSMWQYHGYSLPVYPNVEYPIPFDPPYVGNYNPVGYYRKKFTALKGGRKILYFGGVDSAFFVYLNGEYVGFSKGSRLPSEFDVTDLICDGENILCVKVFTYSDGTYLENQDMLLASGIFRDVFLYNLADVSVWDYSIKTENNRVYVDVALYGHDLSCANVIANIDGQSIVLDAKENLVFSFEIDSVTFWNAEEPFTYKLILTLTKNGKVLEVHSKKFGFAEYVVSGNKLLLNGQQITIKGINRHEHDPKNGRAITVERIEKELKIIKSHNMNAIRCAHYPNHPAFYEIATELGIYVMNEADIETHGAAVVGDMGYFSKHNAWYPSYIDRVERMYERDKNETCISIWTIGNENGDGENIHKCIEYLRSRPIKKPIMHTGDDYENPLFGEFRSEGYFTMSALTSHSHQGRPVMLLEYGHAMGNSPGLMEDTWDYVYTHRHICGGYVWEFKNHGFYSEDEEGNAFYKYGGDFGDINHWSNFSMDGYCVSDGTVKPSLRDCKNVLAPTYITYDGNEITLMNTNDFKALNYLTLKWEIVEDYKQIKNGEMKLPKILPYCSETLDIDTAISSPVSGAKYFVNLRFFDEIGEEVAFKQIDLGVKKAKKDFEPEAIDAHINNTSKNIEISNNTFKVKIQNGLLCYYEVGGSVLISESIKFNLHRAPTDNDGIVNFSPRWIERWNNSLIKHFEFLCHEMTEEKSENYISVKAYGRLAPISKYVGFITEIEYKIFNDGLVLFDIHATPYGKFPSTLPKIGLCFTLDKKYSEVTWYGRGEDENYCDRKAHCNFGLYSLPVDKMNFIYDVPQECGNRIDNSFIAVKDDRDGIGIIGSDTFDFSYHDFSLEDLERARHRNELKKSNKNYLYIDYATRGIGSHSCGPDPEESYELRAHEFRFAFILSSQTDTDKLLSLSRLYFGAKTEKLSDTYIYEENKNQRINIVECNINR